MNISLFISNLLLQAGIVFAGAAAFWGFYFVYRAHHEPEAVGEWGGLSKSLSPVLVVSVLMSVIGWFMSSPKDQTMLIFGILLLPLTLFLALAHMNSLRIYNRLEPLYFSVLVIVFTAIIFTSQSILLISELFALGTVFTMGILYLSLKKTSKSRRVFMDSLPFILHIIWLGIAIDFIIGIVQFGPEFFYGQVTQFNEAMFAMSIILLSILSGFFLPLWIKRIEKGVALSLTLKTVIGLSLVGLFVSLFTIRTLRSSEIILINISDLTAIYLLGILGLFAFVVLIIQLRTK